MKSSERHAEPHGRRPPPAQAASVWEGGASRWPGKERGWLGGAGKPREEAGGAGAELCSSTASSSSRAAAPWL